MKNIYLVTDDDLRLESFLWRTKVFLFILSGIFPSTFLQPVNGSKNSILNWVMKLSPFMCFYFYFLFLKHLERFSILFTYSSYPLVLILTNHIKESCMYLSSQLFFKTPRKVPQKINFVAMWRPKFQKIFLWCLPWGHPAEPLY